MKIFIDANILLDFYRISNSDLEELRKIAKLSKARQIHLIISDYLIDEFRRSREDVIGSKITELKRSQVILHLPIIAEGYKEAKKLKKLKKEFEKAITALLNKITEESKALNKLTADSVISDLFSSSKTLTISDEICKAGIDRNTHLRPPGKKDSCGDAIHWEWLLSIVPKNDDLIIISRDKDFESPLHPGLLCSYLHEEWEKKKGSECILYTSLREFLKKHFPEIQISDYEDKARMAEMTNLWQFTLSDFIKAQNVELAGALGAVLDAQNKFSLEQLSKALSLTAKGISEALGNQLRKYPHLWENTENLEKDDSEGED